MSDVNLDRWPRRPARLATAVIEDLVDRIVGRDFEPGSTLPTEPALCENFGVSRSVLREAVKALEAMGLIAVQQGHGTTVLDMRSWDLMNPTVLATVIRHDAELAALDHLIEVRCALETALTRTAATRIGPAELDELFARYDELERLVDNPDAYAAADVAFHDAILSASGNMLGRSIISVLTVEAYRSLRYIGTPRVEDRRASNKDHLAIRDAVASGDGEAAAQLMADHIMQAWERRRPKPARAAT